MQAGMIALQAIPAIIQGVGAMKAGNAEAASLAEDARRTELQANLDAAEARHASRAALGAQMAALADAGVVGGGSAFDIIAQSQVEAEFERMSLIIDGRAKADSMRGQARQANAAGRNAMIGGLLNAGASALGAYDAFQGRKQVRTAIERGRSAETPGRIPVPRQEVSGG